MKFKSRYNVPSNISYHTKIEGPSLTSQKYKDRVDLNKIVGFESGQLIIKDERTFLDTFDESALYNDFTGANQIVDCVGMTFSELSSSMANLENQFNDLPSEVRKKYNNDVNVFLDSIQQHQKASPVISEKVVEAQQTVVESKQPSEEKSG